MAYDALNFCEHIPLYFCNIITFEYFPPLLLKAGGVIGAKPLKPGFGAEPIKNGSKNAEIKKNLKNVHNLL